MSAYIETISKIRKLIERQIVIEMKIKELKILREKQYNEELKNQRKRRKKQQKKR